MSVRLPTAKQIAEELFTVHAEVAGLRRHMNTRDMHREGLLPRGLRAARVAHAPVAWTRWDREPSEEAIAAQVHPAEHRRTARSRDNGTA
jgi:hypothetical protein